VTRIYTVNTSKTGIFLVSLSLLAGLSGCNMSADAADIPVERSALLVEVEAAEPASAYTVRREFSGRVEARRSSELGFELGGELVAVRVEEGDYVDAGQVLASLDTARLQARLAEAEAALAQARSARDFARSTLERSREAAAFEGISAQELDLAVDNANSAAAAAAAAEARVNSVRVDIDKSSIRAPFEAVVIGRRADEGQIVAAGQPVLELQESAAPEVRIGVAGAAVSSLEPGQQQVLEVDGRNIRATVNAVLPRRDPATRTIDVILAIEDGEVVPGDLARLALEQPVEADGFWLPVGALAEGNRGLWNAYVATPVEYSPATAGGATHVLEPRVVEILFETADRVFVRGALYDGDLFVTSGLTRVVPNQQVRLKHRRDKDALAANGP
jgi:RND family efflux transporter MFP subunit